MSTGDPHVHALRRRALDRGDLQQEVRARLTSAVGGPVGHAQTRARPARGCGSGTAYLSLTGAVGGERLLGPQLGEALGAARTEELLAARRVGGGRQYFGGAKDFG